MKGDGVAGFAISTTARVTLRRLSDCDVVVTFVVEPGSRTAIQFDENGFDRVDQEGGLDGPGFGSPDSLLCGEPHDTSTIKQPSQAPTQAVTLLLATAVAGLIFGLRRTAGPVRHRRKTSSRIY